MPQTVPNNKNSMFTGIEILIPPSIFPSISSKIIALIANEQGLCKIILPTLPCHLVYHPPSPNTRSYEILSQASRQINRYLLGRQHTFELYTALEGTSFQKKVWALIKKIPYGETVTYSTLATQLGDRHKARAVGNAANKNPLPIIIPCHRIIGSNGSLTGYAGGLELKLALLKLEKHNQTGEN